ncbi:tyrosine-type recombinase/integrase [Rhodovulum sulfidophilum]|nr:tyrosine-type recombinase/integrase [Rhodovulum sulfidophilum]MCE8458575.1 tyrosine-type recombinase/integrase [Rhodovulum sulfidophilum]
MDDPAFLAAYASALASAPKITRAKPGTIAMLIEAFLGGRDYLSRSESYRRTIRRHAEAIKAQADDALARDLREQDIEADLSPLCPNAAADRLKAWRMICRWGKTNGYLARDPSLAVKRKPIPKTIGHPAWTDAEIDRFRAHWALGSVQRLCFELVFWTGARISDAVKIGPGMAGRDGVLQFTQKKTGEPAFVPWTCPLPAYAVRMEDDRKLLFAALEARAERHMTFLATAYGTTRSEKALGHVISNAASKLGIAKSAHGLRKSRAKLLAEAGATVHQIAAWTGHITLEEVEHYTREASRRAAVRGEQMKKPVNR